MSRLRALRFLSALLLLLQAPIAAAQLLQTPQASPHARVEERVGITDIAVDYHRPSVKGRRIFGGLVPHGVPWRAGANEPTTVEFSTPVKVEGQPLAAGKYSMFITPGQQEWGVTFNRFTGGWGTYSYDPKEDVLRVNAKAEPAEMQERLAFTFDDTKDDATTLSMRWEKVRLPLKITVDTPALVAASIKDALRSELHWVPQAWVEASSYALRSGDTETALAYAERAVELSPDARSLRMKARVLEKKGDVKSANELRASAATIAPRQAAMSNAYSLIGAKKYDEADAAIGAMVKAEPKLWRVWVAQGDLYAARGEAAKALEAYQKAMSFAPTQSERVEVQDSINEMASRPGQ